MDDQAARVGVVGGGNCSGAAADEDAPDIAALDRASILGADDLPITMIDVPEWGGAVCIRTLTGAERDAYEASCLSMNGNNRSMNLRNVRAKLASLAICDERGKRLFSDGDIAALGRKSSKALDRVFDAARKLNGLTPEDVEELAGESDSGQSDDSGIG